MGEITSYASLPGTAAPGDILVVVDVDDTSMSGSGTTKQMTVSQLPGASGDLLAANNLSDVASVSAARANLGVAAAAFLGTITTFIYGSTGGVPSAGTWVAGDIAIDQRFIVRVCTSGGTPGTWRRLYARPYQFFLDDYAKGDGVQCLVNVVNGSATINTTPLAAPAAPAPTNTGSGGTILAGTYGVIVTYLNRWGETVGSAAGTTTTSGSASTITVPSPPPSGNATGWYAYVTGPGGSTYYRQQAPGSPTALQVPLTLTAPPTSSGANPPGADSSAAQVFSAATDVGKNIMICGAQGSPGGPCIDTISAVNSPTQAVITTAGNITASQAGCPMVFSTDDRLNVDACISAAVAYALSNQNLCEVIAGDRIYGLGTGMFQSVATTAGGPGVGYNTQVRVPVGNASGQTEKLEFRLLGPGDNSHARFWVSQYVNLNGCTFVSYSLGPNSNPDPTYGQQSIIGGPQAGTGSNGSNGFANVNAVIKGVNVIQPGWSNSIGIDLQWIAGCVLRGRSAVFAPGFPSSGVVNPCSAWPGQTFWVNNKIGTAVRLPNALNNAEVIVESLAMEGLNRGLSFQCDHAMIYRLESDSMYDVLFITGGDINTHNLEIAQWSFSGTAGAAINVLSGVHFVVNIVMDGEQGGIGFDVKDPGNALYGRILWNDPFRAAGGPANIIAPVVSGAANVEIINRQLVRQVYGAPTYTLGTALQNPWFGNMLVSLAGGTVTNVQIGPTSAACTTSVATSTPCSFKLPSGWWLNITGSVKPTTFNAVPD